MPSGVYERTIENRRNIGLWQKGKKKSKRHGERIGNALRDKKYKSFPRTFFCTTMTMEQLENIYKKCGSIERVREEILLKYSVYLSKPTIMKYLKLRRGV